MSYKKLMVVGDRERFDGESLFTLIVVSDEFAILCDFTSIGLEVCNLYAKVFSNAQVFTPISLNKALEKLGSGWRIDARRTYYIAYVLFRYNIKTTDDLREALNKHGTLSAR